MIGLIKFISNGCPPPLWRTNKLKAERCEVKKNKVADPPFSGGLKG